MRKKVKNRIWLLLPVVLLAAFGFYLFSQLPQEQERRYPVETKPPSEEKPVAVEGEKDSLAGSTIEEKASKEAFSEQDPCSRIEKKMAEFFRYLDKQPDVRHLDLEADTYTRFKEIIKRLSERPPVPAGEGTDPKIIIRNIYHFFRVLNNKDLRLIKKMIGNEQDTLEIELAMFYKWFMLYDRCPDPEGLRPSMEVLYKYAGFFINTTGGRAYLFRRTSTLRLLVTYYCILIVHEADRTGKNSYGIDISPYIPWLSGELTRYPDFKFHQMYLDLLNLIESYYLQKRSQDL